MRGEVALVSGGRRLTLCLTMGALAEIEGALGGRRGAPLSGADVIAMLRARVKGGGEIEAAAQVAMLMAGAQ